MNACVIQVQSAVLVRELSIRLCVFPNNNIIMIPKDTD